MKISEHNEAIAFAQWLQIMKNQGKIVWFTKTCQETWTKSGRQKHKNKQEGLSKGLTDYIIVLPKKILFIELKSKKGIVSPAQKECISAICSAGGVAFVAYGADEAINLTAQYLREL